TGDAARWTHGRDRRQRARPGQAAGARRGRVEGLLAGERSARVALRGRRVRAREAHLHAPPTEHGVRAVHAGGGGGPRANGGCGRRSSSGATRTAWTPPLPRTIRSRGWATATSCARLTPIRR